VGKIVPELGQFEARFCKRMRNSAWSLEVYTLPEGRSKQLSQRKQEEEKSILKAVSPKFILFDEKGKLRTSIQWLEYFQQLPGNAEIDLVIGGAAGVSDALRRKAGGIWSLSLLTLPHQLVRVMVVEQLYRAYTMSIGHPYHRE